MKIREDQKKFAHFPYLNLDITAEISSVGPDYNADVGVHKLLTVLWVDREAKSNIIIGGRWAKIGNLCIHLILHHPRRLHTTVYFISDPHNCFIIRSPEHKSYFSMRFKIPQSV